MYGLINRAIQCFICDTYGPDSWKTIAGLAGLGFENFEAMLSYDDELTGAVLSGATVTCPNQQNRSSRIWEPILFRTPTLKVSGDCCALGATVFWNSCIRLTICPVRPGLQRLI